MQHVLIYNKEHYTGSMAYQ